MTWSDRRVVVELSVLRQIRHDPHTVPAAVQFAIQQQNVCPDPPDRIH